MRYFLVLLLLVSCVSEQFVSFESGARFKIEVADSPEARAKGLMFRSSLADDSGMLFVFDEDSSRNFWMKNTLIPLDMIFINSDLRVVEIKHNVLPCEEDPCPSYKSEPAMYVLEVNAGLAEKNNIEVGSLVSVCVVSPCK